MAVYQVSIIKVNTMYSIGAFRNVYHVNAGSAAEAIDQGQTILSLEVPVFSTTTEFLLVEAILPGVRGAGGRLDQVGNSGERVAGGGVIPPWNVCMVTWKPALTSRRLRKYLRIGLAEDDIAGQTLQNSIRDLLDTYNAGILNDTDVCAPDGGILDSGSGSTYGYVAMRQTDHNRLHRPGFHRGWVPD